MGPGEPARLSSESRCLRGVSSGLFEQAPFRRAGPTLRGVSKAFTSEETEDAPVLGRLVVRAPRGQERPMTPAGYRALVAEQARLTGERLDASDEGRKAQLEHRLAVVAATLESGRVGEPRRRR